MTVYTILKESYLDDDFESEILDNECYANEITAYDKMLEEAQMTVDDLNKNPPGEFKLEVFPKVHSCSVNGEYEADFVNYYIVPMEVK